MQAIHIRDVPDDVVAALKRRARANRRSLQGELLVTLEEAARRAPPEEPPPPLVLMVSEAPASTGTWSRDDLYDDDAR
jgi:plasmid stability protein